MKVATWNVNGIRARETQFAEWVERDQPDVICLQEIKAAPDKVPASICDLAGYSCYWHGERGYSGVGLHVRDATLGQSIRFEHPDFDHENRIVTATGANLVITSVYVPNGGKDYPAKLRFLQQIDVWSARLIADGRDLIICGDINIAREERDVHPKERKPNAIGQLPEEREIFEHWLSHGLTDLGRHFDPHNENLFTWWAPWRNLRQRNIGWRLDYVLASPALTARATGCIVQPEVGTSDHAPVVATFS